MLLKIPFSRDKMDVTIHVDLFRQKENKLNVEQSKQKNMKKMIAPITLAIAVVLSAVGCGGKKDPVTYNNEVITVINGNEKHINDMNAAMGNRDYEAASKAREEWEKSILEDIEKIEKIGDFNGDDNLQQAVLTGLKGYKKIVEEDYPKLIDIRKNDSGDAETEKTLLDNINDAFEKMANGVNEASNRFAKDHLTNLRGKE